MIDESTLPEFIEQKLRGILIPLIRRKGAEYSGSGLIDESLTAIATLAGSTVLQSWLHQFSKQVVALSLLLRHNIPASDDHENIESRIVDCLCYLFLLWAIHTNLAHSETMTVPDIPEMIMKHAGSDMANKWVGNK